MYRVLFLLGYFLHVNCERCEHGLPKISLTFVIDGTWSMGDDIDGVKKESVKIFDNHLEDSRIENYVVVDFRDPTVKLGIKTTDREELKSYLNDFAIDVKPNRDCPEMSMTGIIKAIDESLPGSILYVFTDASAKDYKKGKELSRKAQEKQLQVVFILTGTCKGDTDPAYVEYFKIAKATNGIVFEMMKRDVEKILKWVDDNMKAHLSADQLLNQDFESGKQTVVLQLDSHHTSLSVTVSALPCITGDPGIVVAIRGSEGAGAMIETVVDLKNTKIEKVVNVVPGPYNVEIKSSCPYRVSASARTSVGFSYGFSMTSPPAFDLAPTRPVAGVESYLLVKLNGDVFDVQVKSVNLLRDDGTVVLTQGMNPTSDPNVYVSKDIVTVPCLTFSMEVILVDTKNNTDMVRKSPTPVTTIDPKIEDEILPNLKPAVNIKDGPKLQFDIHSQFSIKCEVKAYPTPIITWTNIDNPLEILPSTNISESAYIHTSTLTLNVTNHVSKFRCEAANVAGADSADVQVEPKPYFKMIEEPKDASIKYKGRGQLRCLADAYPAASALWRRAGEALQNDSHFEISDNGTELTITDMDLTTVGSYVCAIGGNTYAANVNISDLVKPTAHIKGGEKVKVDVNSVTSLDMECVVTAYPKPEIVWSWTNPDNVHEVLSSVNISESAYIHTSTLTLNVTNHVSKFRCEAANVAGADSADVQVEPKPYFKMIEEPKDASIKYKGRGQLRCRADAYPAASALWRRAEVALQNDSHFEISDNGTELTITDMDLTTVGSYVCAIGGNTYAANVNISDLAKPTAYIKGGEKVKVDVNSVTSLDMECVVTAYPKPEIVWSWTNPDNVHEVLSSVTISNAANYSSFLSIPVKGLTHVTKYRCKASNIAGEDSADVEVNPYNVKPYFLMVEKPKDITIKYKESGQLTCKADAYPPVVATWKHAQNILTNDSKFEISEDGSQLTIRSMDMTTHGTYVCFIGNVSFGVKATFKGITPPVIETIRPVKVLVGKTAVLECKVLKGSPKPTISWQFKSQRSNHYTVIPGSGEKLVLTNATAKDAGRYKCLAINDFGKKMKFTTLSVGNLPKIEETTEPIIALQNHSAEIPCKVVEGKPEPTIKWQFKHRDSSNYTDIRGSAKTLVLDTITEDNSGIYRCLATNLFGRDVSDVTLVIGYFPKIVEPSETKFLKLGETAQLSCSVSGVPPPNATWQLDGENLDIPYSMQSNNSINVTVAGSYTCEATNEFGSAKIDVALDVYVPIEMKRTLGNHAQVVKGGRLELPCAASGTPVPEVHWEFWSDSEHTNISFAKSFQNYATLILDSVLPESQGRYTCVAANRVEEQGISYYVEVLSPPEIQNGDSDRQIPIAVDGDVGLPCRASGNPKPDITWTFNDKLLELLSEPLRYEISKDGTLTVRDSLGDSSGIYTCHARSQIGQKSANFTVFVAAPEKTGIIGNVTMIAGSSGVVLCPIPHTSSDVLIWFKDGKLLTKGQLVMTRASTLDSGVYTCRVSQAPEAPQDPQGPRSGEVKVSVGTRPVFIGADDDVSEDNSILYEDLNLNKGEDAVLDCSFEGDPAPTITWWRNGTIISYNKEQPDLYTFVAEPGETDGVYYCTVGNELGEIHKKFTVNISDSDRYISDIDYVDTQ